MCVDVIGRMDEMFDRDFVSVKELGQICTEIKREGWGEGGERGIEVSIKERRKLTSSSQYQVLSIFTIHLI